jgi:transposase
MQYHIYTIAVDMRKGYDGLSGIVTNELQKRPTDGCVYIFFNATRDKVKMLIWDHDGYVIYAKRLERGRFEQLIYKDQASKSYTINYNHLVMLMSGVSLVGLKQKYRYQMHSSTA